MAGRPRGTTGSKRITEALTKEICDLIEIGMPSYHAAIASGVESDTFRKWIEKAKQGERAYLNFYRAITRARARAMANMLVKSLEGEKGSAAAMWILERRYSKHFSLKSKEKEKQEFKITVEGGLPEFPREKENEVEEVPESQ